MAVGLQASSRSIVTLGAGPDPEHVFLALAGRPGRAWFDGGPGRRGFLTWGAGPPLPTGGDWVEVARRAREAAEPLALPFAGGLVGCLGYEAGRACERMPVPRHPRPMPDSWLVRVPGALWWLPGRGWVAAGSAGFAREAAEVLRAARHVRLEGAPWRGRVVDPGDPEGFVAGVARVLDHIRAGDCYQVNLARRIALEGGGRPDLAWLVLRRAFPAPLGAYLDTPWGAVLSNSPELFLRVSGDTVLSRPIKGTRPRADDPAADRSLAGELLADPKERAELTMIVDLVRNDLGRVCRPGTVRWGPRRVGALPTVHHAHQEVWGRLARGRAALDAVRAAFPPGSVTGAPKVRAMEIIARLEPAARGVYTGAIGFFDDGGDACLNVAIRTATIHGSTAFFHVGCGIVAASVPRRELDESGWKARALARVLAADEAALVLSSSQGSHGDFEEVPP